MRLLILPVVSLAQIISLDELTPELVQLTSDERQELQQELETGENISVEDPDSDEALANLSMAEFDDNLPSDIEYETEDLQSALRSASIDYSSICGRPTTQPHGDLFFDLPLNPLTVESLENQADIDRIVGGTEVIPHSWPWQAKVKICSRWRCTKLCGGSIISSYYVVTAAHCIPPRGHTGFITVGDHEITDLAKSNDKQNFAYRKTYKIIKVLGHRYWNKRSRYNDIALLKSNARIIFNDGVTPICLPNKDVCINDHTACVVTGWGRTAEGGDTSDVLQEVAVRTLPDDMCARKLIYDKHVNAEKQVCAGFVEGGKDSCSGDSGGPLVCKAAEDGPWMLYGIVSWGFGCARKNKPGVYTRVSTYVDWIEYAIRRSRGGTNRIGKLSGAGHVCLTCGNIGEQCDPELVGTYSSDTMPEVTNPPTTTTTTTTTTTIPTTSTTAIPTTTTEKNEWDDYFAADDPVTEVQPDGGYVYTSECGSLVSLTNEKGGIRSVNFGTRYPGNQRCKWTIGTDSPNEFNQVNVKVNDLDLTTQCGRKGDRLVLRCKKRTDYYCDGRTTNGQYANPLFECNGKITIEFISDSKSINDGTGFDLIYRHRPNAVLNKCGNLAQILIDSRDPFSRHNFQVWPLKTNWDCTFFPQCPNGQRITAEIDRVKTFLPAREKLVRKGKRRYFTPVTCYDKMTVFYGTKYQRQICGKRSLSPTKVLRSGLTKGKIRLETDHRFNMRERVSIKFSC